jgi:hypothetical protein
MTRSIQKTLLYSEISANDKAGSNASESHTIGKGSVTERNLVHKYQAGIEILFRWKTIKNWKRLF